MNIIIKKFNKEKQIKTIMEYLYSLDFVKPIQVLIEPMKKKRSLDQNAVYWIWMKIICIEQDGNFNPSKFETEIKHENFKEMFLDPRETKSGRKFYSTTKLSTNEFNDYMEKIKMACIEYIGLTLFYPSDGEVFHEMLAHYKL